MRFSAMHDKKTTATRVTYRFLAAHPSQKISKIEPTPVEKDSFTGFPTG